MNAISPGVYATIIPLASYVQSVPSSTGFICFLSDKGPDNVMTFIGGNQQLHQTYGDPNIVKYSSAFGSGLYVADSFTQISNSLYAMRVLPPDATYANIAYYIMKRQNIVLSELNVQVYFSFETMQTSIPNLTSTDELTTNFSSQTFTSLPKLILTGSDGVTYQLSASNGTSPTLVATPVTVSPTLPTNGVYVVNASNELYQIQINNGVIDFVDTTKQLATSDSLPPFYVKSQDGTQIYQIVYANAAPFYSLSNVTATYTNAQAWEFVEPLFAIYGVGRGQYYNNYQIDFQLPSNLNYPLCMINELKSDNQYHNVVNIYTSFNPQQLDPNGNSAFIEDVFNMNVSDLAVSISTESVTQINSQVMEYLNAKDSTGNFTVGNIVSVDYMSQVPPSNPVSGTRYFALQNSTGAWFGYDGNLLSWNSTSNTWNVVSTVPSNVIMFLTSNSTFYIHLGFGRTVTFDPFTYAVLAYNAQTVNFTNGSDGSLFTSSGTVNPTVATQLLSQAYIGVLDPNVTNTENYYIDLVFDANYPMAVKNQIVSLVSDIRRDCVAIMDINDQPNITAAVNQKIQNMYIDTPYVALYMPFVNIYDVYTGKNIWITPVYIMANLIAENDRTNYVWYAVAGAQNGVVNGINGLRFNSSLSSRDQEYLNQLNPIVKFNNGTMVWGNLTTWTQPDPSANLSVMRMALYVQRALKQYCNTQIFNFDDPTTYGIIQSAITVFLNDVQKNRGLTGFNVSVSATAQELANKSAEVNVILYVNNPLEKIYLNLFLSNPVASGS